MKIINNIKENHLLIISDYLNKAEKVFISIAFFKKSGLKLIEQEIKNALERNTEITIVCGLDFYQTEPDVLKEIHLLSKKYENCKLFTCQQKGSITFHPKIYYFSNNEINHLIIGSANLTQGGLKDNYEVSILSSFTKNTEQFKDINLLKEDILSRSKAINDIEISQYARKFEINSRNQQKAEKQIRIEENAVFQLNLDEVDRYLKEYLSNKKEQNDYQIRIENYKEAYRILDEIKENTFDKAEFQNRYNQLVSGKKGLWYSGGLARNKNEIINDFLGFKELINTVYLNLETNPKNILKKTEKYYKVGASKKIIGLGINIITEILNTLRPQKYAVLNQNPLTSIDFFGFEKFPNSQFFKPENYEDFNNLVSGLKNYCKFETLGQVDSFLNFIFQKIKHKEINIDNSHK